MLSVHIHAHPPIHPPTPPTPHNIFQALLHCEFDHPGGPGIHVCVARQAGELWEALMPLMEETGVDYTIFFRQLSHCDPSVRAPPRPLCIRPIRSQCLC